MKRFLLHALILVFAMLTMVMPALALDTYVFPSDGFRYTQREGETVLTRTNLGTHEDFILSLGTTVEAMRAYYASAGIAMEVYTDAGGQFSISVATAAELTSAFEIGELTEEERGNLLEKFLDSGFYEECNWSDNPDWLRFTSSATLGDIPVWQLRYMTLHLGKLYTVGSVIVDREPEASDDAEMLSLIGSIRMLSSVVQPTASPTPAPTATPVSTATPAPVPAATRLLSGTIKLDDLPSVVNKREITISGTVEARAGVTIRAEETILGMATAGADGRFTLRIVLPEEGENRLTIESGENLLEITVEYEQRAAKIEITEPLDTTFTGHRVLVRGVTEPNATVYVTGEQTSTNVKANKNGVFTVPIFMESAGTRTYTLRVHSAGMADTTVTVTLTRVLTEREEITAFKETQVYPEYEDLIQDPSDFAGQHFTFRGKVMAFTDYDGTPCALVCVKNPRTGVWQDPLYCVLPVDNDIEEEEIVTFYLIGDGITMPASGQYTESGSEEEAPVARVFWYTRNR